MELHRERILEALPTYKNHTDVLIKVNHLSKLSHETKSRNESMCRKCLTPWSLGKFTLSTIASNHHRKKRRQFQIERLQKQIKSGESSKTDGVNLTRKLKRLQQLNNHVALYKCFCNSTTKVQLKKVAATTTRTIEEKKDHDTDAVSTKPSKDKKDKKRKRKKTAGLNIPKPSAPSATTSVKFSQLSNFIQNQKSDKIVRKSNLDQFLK